MKGLRRTGSGELACLAVAALIAVGVLGVIETKVFDESTATVAVQQSLVPLPTDTKDILIDRLLANAGATIYEEFESGMRRAPMPAMVLVACPDIRDRMVKAMQTSDGRNLIRSVTREAFNRTYTREQLFQLVTRGEAECAKETWYVEALPQLKANTERTMAEQRDKLIAIIRPFLTAGR